MQTARGARGKNQAKRPEDIQGAFMRPACAAELDPRLWLLAEINTNKQNVEVASDFQLRFSTASPRLTFGVPFTGPSPRPEPQDVGI